MLDLTIDKIDSLPLAFIFNYFKIVNQYNSLKLLFVIIKFSLTVRFYVRSDFKILDFDSRNTSSYRKC